MFRKIQYAVSSLAVVFLASCIGATTTEKTNVFINFGKKVGTQSVSSIIPQDVAEIVINVSGIGVDNVPATVDFSEDTGTASFEVSSGYDRVFEAEAYNINGEMIFQGSTTTDLEPGDTVEVVITLKRIATSTTPAGGEMLTFGFDAALNPWLGGDIVATIIGNIIMFKTPITASVLGLKPTFTTNDGATVTVNGIQQTSGTSTVDFNVPVIYSVDGTEYYVYVGRNDMVTVPATISYVMGCNDGDPSYIASCNTILGSAPGTTPKYTVNGISEFDMGIYEVTYELWNTVATWASSHGYTNMSAGQQGSTGGGAIGQPVTMITKLDAAAFCNALSEMEGITPVYYTSSALITVYRNASLSLDADYVKLSSNGYRLPTETEWDYAATYVDGVSTTQINRASGDSTTGASYTGTATVYANYNSSGTVAVGTLFPNFLGIYDMSGNVKEWLWDNGNMSGDYTFGGGPFTGPDPVGPTGASYALYRGGSWSDGGEANLAVARRGNTNASSTQSSLGFRIVRRQGY